MIYIFGIPTQVAAGTELYLAIFTGAYGALNYALQGMVDPRLTMLLLTGSLFGIHLGAYGTKVVREVVIRLVTACIILLCVVSRTLAIPVYLRQLGCLDYAPLLDRYFSAASQIVLYASGILGTFFILFFVFRASLRRRKMQTSLIVSAGNAPLALKGQLHGKNV